MNIGKLPLSQLHTLVHADYIQQVCSPLKKLGINYFSLARIYKDKQIIRLANYNSWTTHMHVTDWYYSIDATKFYASDHVELNNFCGDTELNLAKNHGFEKGFMINVEYPDYIDRYFCCFELGKAHMQSQVLENLSLIYQFIAYFNEHTYSLISEIKRTQPVYVNAKSQIASVSDPAIEMFLKEVKLNKITLEINNQKIKLSRQQLRLLLLWQSGLTAKQIAKEMQLTYRTVQFYTQQLRTKFQVIGIAEPTALKLSSLLKILHKM